MPDTSAFLFIQLDADRDEEEVFCDISMTVDNKLYPSKEPVAGKESFFYKILHKINIDCASHAWRPHETIAFSSYLLHLKPSL